MQRRGTAVAQRKDTDAHAKTGQGAAQLVAGQRTQALETRQHVSALGAAPSGCDDRLRSARLL
ncbi:MAG: hypothetical protein QM758_27590 [Armatimonas sp.]